MKQRMAVLEALVVGGGAGAATSYDVKRYTDAEEDTMVNAMSLHRVRVVLESLAAAGLATSATKHHRANVKKKIWKASRQGLALANVRLAFMNHHVSEADMAALEGWSKTENEIELTQAGLEAMEALRTLPAPICPNCKNPSRSPGEYSTGSALCKTCFDEFEEMELDQEWPF